MINRYLDQTKLKVCVGKMAHKHFWIKWPLTVVWIRQALNFAWVKWPVNIFG